MEQLPPVAILAGGFATRLGLITKEIPKALVTVNGKPFIFHQLEQLRAEGIARVVCCVGYKGEMIEKAVGDGSRFDLHVVYSYDGETLLGTGGSVKRAISKLGESFFILYGDSYLKANYRKIKMKFDQTNKKGLLTVFENRGVWDTSNLSYQDGRIIAYSKKKIVPEMTHIDYGLSLLEADVFINYPEDEIIDLADVYEKLVYDNELAGLEITDRFYEIGSPKGLQELEAFIQSKGEI